MNDALAPRIIDAAVRHEPELDDASAPEPVWDTYQRVHGGDPVVSTVSFSDSASDGHDYGEGEYGRRVEGGIPCESLRRAARRWARDHDMTVDVYELSAQSNHRMTPEELRAITKKTDGVLPEATVLVIRDWGTLTDGRSPARTSDALAELHYDTTKPGKARGSLVNSHARHSTRLMPGVDHVATEEDRRKGIASINDLNKLPDVQTMLRFLESEFAVALPVVRTWRYFDPASCGIGWHGDTERDINVIIRYGVAPHTRPLNCQWYFDCCPVGAGMKLPMLEGQVMVMSRKALGTDYPTRLIPTVRHAVGVKQTVRGPDAETRAEELAAKKARKRAREEAKARDTIGEDPGEYEYDVFMGAE